MTVVGAAFAVIVAAVVALSAGPAAAQFGGPFDTPPRPPGSVPTRPPAQLSPPQSLQPPLPPQVPQLPSSGVLTPPGPPTGRSAIQSEELPPPGAAPAALPLQSAVPPQPLAETSQPSQLPQSPQPSQPTTTPGARQQRSAAPPEDVVTQPPSQKIANPSAMFSGLDKITGRITAFDAAIGETVQFGALQVTARACYSRPPTETPLTDGFVEVDEVTLQGEVRRIFTGWMFAASPGLHAVEHPIYDVWLTGCKGGASAAVSPAPGAPAPPAVADAQSAPPARSPPQRQSAPRAPAAAPQYPGGQRQTLPPPGTLLPPNTNR